MLRKVVLNRNWACGLNELKYVNYLRDHRGKMCCLGFDALDRGISKKAILGKGDPNEVEELHGTELVAKSNRGKNSKLANMLIEINDFHGQSVVIHGLKQTLKEFKGKEITKKERVDLLNEVCKENGAGFRFELKGSK